VVGHLANHSEPFIQNETACTAFVQYALGSFSSKLRACSVPCKGIVKLQMNSAGIDVIVE
jgi:hypothetical protein